MSRKAGTTTLRNDHKALAVAAREIVVNAGPGASIGELSRLCAAAGLNVPRKWLVKLRQQVVGATATANIQSLTALAGGLKLLAEEAPTVPVSMGSMNRAIGVVYEAVLKEELAAAPPPPLPPQMAIQAMHSRQADLQRLERERKATAAQAREAKQFEKQQVQVSFKPALPAPAVSPPPMTRQQEEDFSAAEGAAWEASEAWARAAEEDLARSIEDGDFDAELKAEYEGDEEEGEIVEPQGDPLLPPNRGHELPNTVETVVYETTKTTKEDLAGLARQAVDIMRAHQLSELTLTIENGKAKWLYTETRIDEGELSF